MTIVNAKISKKINRYQVLKEIYYKKPISRANLAKSTGLTSASITKIIYEFMKLGIVKEVGRTKTIQGRKPVLIDIVPDSFHIVGIYIARKSISGIITNMNADIVTRISHKGDYLDKARLSRKIIDLIKELFKKSKVNKNNILGIGISVPGPINSKRGEVISDEPPYNWSGVSLKDNIFKEFNIPVFADNCSNVGALGESWFGNGVDYQNFVLLSFGEGVGGGLILDNRLYRGEDDIVAEVGHTTIDINGSKCECGNYGCVELYVKNKTIIKKYNDLVKKYPDSKLAKLETKKVEDIYNFRDQDDPVYKEIIGHIVKYLSTCIINLVNTLNPEAVLITTNELEEIKLDVLVKKIADLVNKRVYPVVRNKVKILPSRFKHNSQLIGAISLVFRDFFELGDLGNRD